MPIMIASAVQNIIALTDQFFLGRVGSVETGAIGFVGVFYLIITAICYGFSKGGQIIIARLVGEGRLREIGKVTYGMLLFEFILAACFFLFVKIGGAWFFRIMVQSDEVYRACLDFLDYRIYGVFFSSFGVAMIALYSGLARTKIIMYNAVFMGLINILLNYTFVFGNFGFEAMGMKGSGLASTLSEGIAMCIFLVYILSDYRTLKTYGFYGERPDGKKFSIEALKKIWKLQNSFKYIRLFMLKELELVFDQLRISMPIIIQSGVGLGSWFLFFIVVEKFGENALEVSSVLRAVYLLLMIPSWGLASGINTIVSTLIGQNRQDEVLATIQKTAMLCFAITMGVGLLSWLRPEALLFVGSSEPSVISGAVKMYWVLMIALSVYSVSAIYFNGMAGTGATAKGLQLQMGCVALYLIYIWAIVYRYNAGLAWAWMSELVYWSALLVFTFLYLRSGKWKSVNITKRLPSTGGDLHF